MHTTLYLICLVAGVIFTLFSAIASHFFGGHDSDIGTGGHAEAGFDDTGVPGISFFSPTVLASFVTAFGAFGLIFSKIGATENVWISAPLSAIGASGIAGVTFWIFNTLFQKTQSSSESKLATTIGMTASILTPIPAGGVGEIAYVQSGSRYTAPARSENGVPIGAGQPVKITRIIGSLFFVVPIN